VIAESTAMMIEHQFKGAGPKCDRCGGAERHHRKRSRAYHAPIGDPCQKCNRPASEHPSPSHLAWRKARDKVRTNRQSDQILGIDGEGHDLPDGSHIYTLLMAVDESGRIVGEAYNKDGLSVQECCRMLLSLPKNALKFVFMGSYDWTKMIEQLSEVDIYHIMHPETRRMRTCKECGHSWRTEEKQCPSCSCDRVRAVNLLRFVTDDKTGKPVKTGFDWFNGSFTVAEPAPREDAIIPGNTFRFNAKKRKSQWGRRTKVWDCFKFFQCSFVKAIKQWDVGTKDQQKRIEDMKKKRGAFDVEDPAAIRQYCKEECQLLAVMMRKVINSCVEAGIELTAYHGAGSIASAFMKKHNIKEHLGPSIETMPNGLQLAIMSAYFGGRFENCIVGEIDKPVYNNDIYSAYPYAIARLPCLACGTWRYHKGGKDTLKIARNATLAVIKFRVHRKTKSQRSEMAWAPFPCREEDGSICYPTGFKGWAWLPEVEAALKGWGDIIELEGCWTYHTSCEHRPFAWVPDAYRKRFEWGKDGRGIVMKLGLNACAGKTMQTEGDPPPFRSHIWGGMITATTRSQSLEAILVAKDPWNILGVATDGVFATEVLDLPKPIDTGTSDLEKPLGAWGKDVYPNGVFFVKPGMYFELADHQGAGYHAFEGEKKSKCTVCGEEADRHPSLMRARGVGRTELTTTALRLIRAFQDWNRVSELKITVKSRRFFGAKSSVLMYSACSGCKTAWPGPPSKMCDKCGKVGDSCRSQSMKLPSGIAAYGRWAERAIDIEFEPHPKREGIASFPKYGRMRIRDMKGATSVPYIPGNTTPLGQAAKEAAEEALEAPDWFDDEIEEETATL